MLPWSRAVASVNDGSITAIAAIYPGEVTRGMLVSSVMGYSTTKAFRKRGSTWRYQGVDSFRLVTLGVVRGYRYGVDIDRYIANGAGQAIVQPVGGGNPVELNIKKLLSGRVDAILANPDVLYFRAQQLGITIDEIEVAGDVSVNSLHVAFSKKNKNSAEYVKVLAAGVKQLRASGELHKILSQYNMSDWLKKGDEKD